MSNNANECRDIRTEYGYLRNVVGGTWYYCGDSESAWRVVTSEDQDTYEECVRAFEAAPQALQVPVTYRWHCGK